MPRLDVNSEQLQRWALIAEIAGGVAVVLTLIFLVLETRENTNAIQAQTYQSLTAELNTFRRFAVEQNFWDLRARSQTEGWESLSLEEQLKANNILRSVWGIYESAYFADKRGVLGEAEWTRFQSAICRNRKLDEYIWGSPETSLSIAEGLTPEFLEFVAANCIDQQSPAN